jgi:hypothetical protein
MVLYYVLFERVAVFTFSEPRTLTPASRSQRRFPWCGKSPRPACTFRPLMGAYLDTTPEIFRDRTPLLHEMEERQGRGGAFGWKQARS